MSTPISRRRLLFGAGAVATSALLAACADEPPPPPAAPAATTGGPWSYDDGFGAVTAPQRPQRIVAYVGSAAALWDLGIKPVGVFGPQRREDGSKDPQAGNVDIDAVTSVGNAWDDFDVEKFLALQPDLLVSGRYGAGKTDLWAIDDPIRAKIEQVAPIVGVNEYKVALPTVIGTYGSLAASLGADLAAPAAVSAKADFDAASAALKTAAEGKSGLKVLVAYADKDNIYVAKPDFFGDLMYFRSLGLDIVSGGGDEEYWEMLSWEQAGKYPADLIITDSRSHALTHQQMAAFPTWARLPAVKAGQIGTWPGESRYSNQLSATIVKDLTALVEKARTDIV